MQITKERVYKVKSFNSTFMELKLLKSTLMLPWLLRFNRTFMELKFEDFKEHRIIIRGF